MRNMIHAAQGKENPVSFAFPVLLSGKTPRELPLFSSASCSLPQPQALWEFRDHILKLRVLTLHASHVTLFKLSSAF